MTVQVMERVLYRNDGEGDMAIDTVGLEVRRETC